MAAGTLKNPQKAIIIVLKSVNYCQAFQMACLFITTLLKKAVRVKDKLCLPCLRFELNPKYHQFVVVIIRSMYDRYLCK